MDRMDNQIVPGIYLFEFFNYTLLTFMITQEFPKQENDYDCGIFALKVNYMYTNSG